MHTIDGVDVPEGPRSGVATSGGGLGPGRLDRSRGERTFRDDVDAALRHPVRRRASRSRSLRRSEPVHFFADGLAASGLFSTRRKTMPSPSGAITRMSSRSSYRALDSCSPRSPNRTTSPPSTRYSIVVPSPNGMRSPSARCISPRPFSRDRTTSPGSAWRILFSFTQVPSRSRVLVPRHEKHRPHRNAELNTRNATMVIPCDKDQHAEREALASRCGCRSSNLFTGRPANRFSGSRRRDRGSDDDSFSKSLPRRRSCPSWPCRALRRGASRAHMTASSTLG